MKKILLIENQYLQFINIRVQLEELKEGPNRKYTVFPELGKDPTTDLQSYMVLTDYVRIALNPRYPVTVVDKALTFISSYIDDKCIDFLIVDYKLVGFDKARNGINLVQDLRGLGVVLPALFFSQTSDDSSDVVELTQDPFLQPFDWVSKSYTDHELLEDNYIAKRVDKKITTLLEKGSDDKLRIDLFGIITHSDMSAYMGTKIPFFRDNIKIIKEFTLEQRNEIKNFRPAVRNEADKRKFIREYEELIKSFMP